MSDRADTQPAGPYVVSLDDRAASDRALVGEKGANLARLVAAEFPVPAGFCVTTVAYRDLVDVDSIHDRIHALSDLDPADTEAIAEAGSTLRDQIRGRDVPAELREQIEQALGETSRSPDGAYAVRSSATAEDLPDASFAGQQETFLNVSGVDDVVDRVRACVASLFTDRAIAYRARNDVAHEDVETAVVVQRMVTPQVSGILFTADPTTGNRRVASIEAGLGLGTALVSGEAAPDEIRVDRRTNEILDYEVGHQEGAAYPRSEGGVQTVELDSADRTSRALSDGQALDVARLGADIERVFDRPQDVEWCIEDGELYVVQARPIPSLFPLPEPMPDDGRLHVYLSVGHTQAMAEAMPPLAVDLWLSVVEDMFDDFDVAGREDRWAVHAGGRVYEDITPFLRYPLVRQQVISGLEPLVEHAADGLESLVEARPAEFEGELSVSLLPSLGRDAVQIARALAPVLPASIAGYCLSFVRAGDDLPRLRQWFRTWGEQAATGVLEPDDPTRRARAVFDGIPFETVTLMRETYPRFVPLLAGLTADKLLKRLFPEDCDAIDAASRGSSDEVGTRMNLGLGRLETVAREHPAVEEALSDGRSLDEIATVDGGDAFVDELETFLDVFGHRTAGEIDPSRPRWRDDPSGVLEIVRGNLRAEDEASYRDHLRERQRAAKRAIDHLEAKAGRGVLGPLRRPLVRRLLRVSRGYIPLRDEPKQGSAHLFAAWHEGLQSVGEHLAANDRIADPDDVWYLRKDELFELLESGDPGSIDIEGRRREHERFARLDPPALLTSEGERLSAVAGQNVADGAFVGTGVSSGVVEGTARVVVDPSETTLEPGEILVSPSCDPAWTPLFRTAAGLVTDVGGRMTHGALVAREYGLPAVMSVSRATKHIETGQRIRVDGSRGTVELLD